MKLRFDQLRTDGGTQPRVALNYTAIHAYMDDMQRGVQFPPLEVWYDGESYWLVDGFHRKEAAFGAELEAIECDVHQGTLEAAQWRSFSVNQKHGLMRTDDDKQQSARAALMHPMGTGKSDSVIAKHVGCSAEWVRVIRARLVSSKKLEDSPMRTVTRGEGGMSKRFPLTDPQACHKLVYMQPREALSATFTPEDMQAMWGLTQLDWRALQQRRLLNASERPHGVTKRTYMTVVQAVVFGLQLALVKEIGLAYADAQNLVREVSAEVEKLFMAPEPAKTLLFAVTKNAPGGKPLWMRINPDSLVADVDARLGNAWVGLNVLFYVNKVCDEIAARDPAYAKWRARQLARSN